MPVRYAPDTSPIVGQGGRATTWWLQWFNSLTATINELIIIAAGGITQLTGPVTTGVGGGVQATTITPTGVTPGTYGDALNVGQFTVAADGRITAAMDVPISAAGTVGPLSPHYEPLTNGNPTNPDLIYNSDGDVVMAWVVP